jgi:plastocyanin
LCAAPDGLLITSPEIIGLSEPDSGGASSVEVVAVTLPVALEATLAEPHSLVVTDGTGRLGCANLEGTLWEGELVTAFAAEGGSGVSGIARVAGGSDLAEATVYLSATDVAEASAETVVIREQDGSWVYDPAVLEIAVGTTVTWVNETNIAHTVTGTTLTYGDSSPIEPGGSWSQTFTEAGTFDYFCSPHPFMTGSVTVVQEA